MATRKTSARRKTAPKKAAKPKKATPVKQEPTAEAQQAEKALVPLAKEINTRFEKAEKFESQADNHRIAAVLQLAKAKGVAKAAGVAFKKWCETEIHYSYHEASRLAKIGEAGDEDKVRLALEDMRKGSASRMKKMRASKAQAAKSAKSASPFEAATSALDRLDQLGTKGIAETAAHRIGYSLVPKAEGDASGEMTAMKHRFKNLKPASAKVEFLEWAAFEVGYKLVSEFDAEAPKEKAASDSDFPDLPDGLKREAKGEAKPAKGRRSRSKKATAE